MRKITGMILTICLLIVVVSLTGRYFYIKSIYIEPFNIVREVVEETRHNKSKSMNLVSEEEWEALSENSIFRIIRKPIDWEEFKSFVQQCEAPSYSLLVDDGKATYNVMKNYYNDKHRTVGVICYQYNKENGQVMGFKAITLLVENLQDSWKVVGKTKE